MKATGIVRRIDDLGRVLIPKDIRRMLGISEGDPVAICVDGNAIILWRYDVYARAYDRLMSTRQQIKVDDGLPAETRDEICKLLDEAAVIAKGDNDEYGS